jgi:hypothetical protein
LGSPIEFTERRALRRRHRCPDELNDQLCRARNRAVERRALLGSECAEHKVRRVHRARRSTDADPQAAEVTSAKSGNDVAQAVVAAVAAAFTLAHLAQGQIEIIVDDEQAVGGRSPALDRLHDELAAVVHEAERQDQARSTHGNRDEAGLWSQAKQLDGARDGAGTEVVACALVLTLCVAEPDDNARRRISRCELVSGWHDR